jgi:hypothetical protein
VPPADPIEHQPVASDVRTLVLSGDYDPVTPPRWGKTAANTLPASYFLEFAGASHGVFLDPCGARLLVEFLRAPDHAPTTQCSSEDRDIAFSDVPFPGVAGVPRPLALGGGGPGGSTSGGGPAAKRDLNVDAVMEALRRRLR